MKKQTKKDTLYEWDESRSCWCFDGTFYFQSPTMSLRAIHFSCRQRTPFNRSLSLSSRTDDDFYSLDEQRDWMTLILFIHAVLALVFALVLSFQRARVLQQRLRTPQLRTHYTTLYFLFLALSFVCSGVASMDYLNDRLAMFVDDTSAVFHIIAVGFLSRALKWQLDYRSFLSPPSLQTRISSTSRQSSVLIRQSTASTSASANNDEPCEITSEASPLLIPTPRPDTIDPFRFTNTCLRILHHTSWIVILTLANLFTFVSSRFIELPVYAPYIPRLSSFLLLYTYILAIIFFAPRSRRLSTSVRLLQILRGAEPYPASFGPTLSTRLILFAFSLAFLAFFPIHLTTSAFLFLQAQETCLLGLMTLEGLLSLLQILSTFFLFWFTRREYRRSKEACVWGVVLRVRETFGF